MIAGGIDGPCCAECAALGDLGDDPLIWTSGAIRSLIDQTNAEIAAIARDVTPVGLAGKLPLGVYPSWRAFYNEWRHYEKTLGFFSTLTGATAMRVKDYRERGIDWRKKLQGHGVTPSSPEPKVTDPSSWPAVAKLAAAAGLTIGAAILISNVTRTARAFSPRRVTP